MTDYNNTIPHKFSRKAEFRARNPMSIGKLEAEVRNGRLILSYIGTKAYVRDDHEAKYQDAIRTSADAPDESAQWRKWRASQGGKASVASKRHAKLEAAKLAAKPARQKAARA
jgi:hypothetical protein